MVSLRNIVVAALIFAAIMCGSAGCRGKELQRRLDEYLVEARWVWGFSGAALVAYDGRIILSAGYGIANREFGELNTPQTKFFIGSVTKQFTAAAIMLLIEQGKLTLDDPVSRHLPDYPQPMADQITIRHLLSHTSGITNYTESPELLWRRTEPVRATELLRSFWLLPLEFPPGSDAHYSNSGYIVLGAIIEAVSGQSYEAFLHHYIFGPLRMHNSGYARREAGLPDRADGYASDETADIREAVPIHYSVLHSAGALYSTTEDLLIWDRALATGTVLSIESIDTMLTPNHGSYGLGWFIDTLYGRRHTFHGGFIDGFNTTVERWPDQKLCVIVLCNDESAPAKKIAHGLAAIVFGEPHDFPVQKTALVLTPKQHAACEGIFELPEGRFRYLLADADTLYTYITGEPPEHLLPQAIDTLFFLKDNTRTLALQRDGDGELTGVVYTNEGKSYLAPRTDPEIENRLLLERRSVKLDTAVLDEFAGVYRMETVFESHPSEFDLTVYRRGHSLFVTGRYTDEVKLFARNRTDFFHQTADFELSFSRNAAGKVVGCILRMAGVEIVGWRL